MQVFNEFSLNYFGSQNLTEEFKSLADAFSQVSSKFKFILIRCRNSLGESTFEFTQYFFLPICV